jgi:hypothetical protein
MAILILNPPETSILSNPADKVHSGTLPSLRRAIAGSYGAKIEPSTDIVIMGIDPATPGVWVSLSIKS